MQTEHRKTSGQKVFSKISERERKAVELAGQRRVMDFDGAVLNCTTCGPMTERGQGLVRQRIQYTRHDGLALYLITTKTICPDCDGYGVQTLPERVTANA